jgi:signal transduction histidine kinase
MWNVLSNAVKFTPIGGRIDIRMKPDGSYVQIEVRDTGIGISADFLAHVFERFRQAHTSSNPTLGGLGLGLALVRYVAEMHGGTVRADSAGLGHGSTFTIRLPLLTARQYSSGFKTLRLVTSDRIGVSSDLAVKEVPQLCAQHAR